MLSKYTRFFTNCESWNDLRRDALEIRDQRFTAGQPLPLHMFVNRSASPIWTQLIDLVTCFTACQKLQKKRG